MQEGAHPPPTPTPLGCESGLLVYLFSHISPSNFLGQIKASWPYHPYLFLQFIKLLFILYYLYNIILIHKFLVLCVLMY